MKLIVFLTILIVLIGACSKVQEKPEIAPTDQTISGNKDLIPNEQDLKQIGMVSNGTDCLTEEYQTGEYSPLGQYSFCSYVIPNLNTEVILEVKKFTNLHDRNGSYQYESLHYRGLQGLISENDYDDMSRFYVNNESTIYYYHLWIAKNEYLIHVTSKGSKEAENYIAKTGERILAKFG